MGPGPAGVWNDPSVLKEGALYRMWLTSSVAPGSADVSVYEATSSDGIAWTIDSNPQIVPGGTNGPWDDARCETPSVIQVAPRNCGQSVSESRGPADWAGANPTRSAATATRRRSDRGVMDPAGR